MRLFFAIFVLVMIGGANAQAQVPAQRKSCEAVQQEVASTGRYYKVANGRDVVPIYPVYADPSVCEPSDSVIVRREPTLDDPRCLVGYACQPPWPW